MIMIIVAALCLVVVQAEIALGQEDQPEEVTEAAPRVSILSFIRHGGKIGFIIILMSFGAMAL